MFPFQFFLQVQFLFTSLTIETQHIRDDIPSQMKGQVLWELQQLPIGHVLPELPSSFLPSLSNGLLFKSYTFVSPSNNPLLPEVY